MGRMIEPETKNPTLSAGSLRALCRAVLADVPGGTAVLFDEELRVWFAEGAALMLTGVALTVGRRLPDVIPAELWQVLHEPYEAAVHGETSSFDFPVAGAVVAIHVSPFALPGGGRAGLAVSREVGEQRRLESAVVVGKDAVLASEELFRSAFEHAPSGISVVGVDGQRLRVNDAYCQMLGYDREELIGTTVGDFTHPEDVSADRKLFTAGTAGVSSDGFENEKRCVRKDGSVVWVQTRSEMVRNQAGEPLFVVTHLQDVSERRAAGEQRRAGDRTLRAMMDNSPAVICVKDRNLRYQLVNRQFEEWCGLPSVQILGLRPEELPDSPAVDGGNTKDQLVLDSGETIQQEETIIRDGQPRVFLMMRFPLFDDQQHVQAVGTMATDITDRRAEEHVKRDRLQCSVDIHAALAQDRFVLHGQPILNLVSKRVEQAELLIRMRKTRDSNELIAPAAFLPAAERFGLIGLIDEWVLARAVELAAAGHRVEVNLSAKTISDPGQLDRIEQVVMASGASPENLIFEITETAVAENFQAAREFAVRLRRRGCAFALDDFGVGHGTFTYLKHLPVDYLKIDLGFVRDLLRGETNRDVVQAIIGVAKQFEIKTIAEGVEDQATLAELRRLGVDFAQGYWIGRPIALDELWQPPDRHVT